MLNHLWFLNQFILFTDFTHHGSILIFEKKIYIPKYTYTYLYTMQIYKVPKSF